jgi:antitoxin component of MazEF toxin-antitoxin module
LDTKQGPVTVRVPAEAAAKAHLKEGDKLEAKQDANGLMLLKDRAPVAYVASKQTQALSHSHELPR